MSDQSPISEPLATAAESGAATPEGPVPGRLDLDGGPEAAPENDGPVPGRPDFDRGPEAAPPTAPGRNPARPTSGRTEAREPVVGPTTDPEPGPELLRRPRHRRGRRLVAPPASPSAPLTPQQRLLLLDTGQRSGLPAGDFAALVGVSKHTLYAWKKKFDTQGPAGLMDQPRGGPAGSKLPELTKRTILMLKQANPDFGCQKISDLLLRGPALPASPAAVARVLYEAGYAFEEVTTRPHPDHVRSFERAQPNQLWQSDLFSFVLKRQNRRVYLVAFLDDHSRFLVSYGLHASQSTALVLEVLRAGLANYGPPAEILTDNGSQYVTWRGQSAFAKELAKRGIRQVMAAPRRPQTLGKIERFWGTLWRECVAAAVFLDLGDAQRRIGLFIDHYNFQRPHQGLGGLVPADRFFGAALEGAADAEGAGGGPCPGAGSARGAEDPLLPDWAGGRSAVQRPCRGRARHPDGRRGAPRGGPGAAGAGGARGLTGARLSGWCRRQRPGRSDRRRGAGAGDVAARCRRAAGGARGRR
jgi:transposase InsO family protein